MVASSTSQVNLQHLVSGGGERGVLGAVAAEGGQRAVGLPAVGLDDEAVRGPVEVGLALAVVGGVQRACCVIGSGRFGAADEPEHPDLPHALGDLRLLPGRLLQDAGSAVPVGAGDDVVDGALVVELQVHGLRQRPLELVVSHRCRQVEQGAVDGRDRDAFVAGGVLGIEGTSAVQADPRDPVPGRGRHHVDALLVSREEPPLRRRAAMAEHRAGPAGQHGCQPMALRDAAPRRRPHRPRDTPPPTGAIAPSSPPSRGATPSARS